MADPSGLTHTETAAATVFHQPGPRNCAFAGPAASPATKSRTSPLMRRIELHRAEQDVRAIDRAVGDVIYSVRRRTER